MTNQNESQKSPQAFREEAVLQYWQDNDIFNKSVEKESPNGEYTFYEGPPTANGRPGIHHVEARSFKDLIPRYKTMQGYKVRRKAGWDTHGLPVELQVEKQLGLKSKKEIESYGVEAFNKKCKESVWEYKDEWERLTARMGFWVDMSDPYITYDAGYMEAVWSIIKKTNDKGLLYKDFKVLPWCPRCGTGLSSHELNQPGAYKDVKDLSVYVKFKLKEGQERKGQVIPENTYMIAWTTTPWTLPGNVALAVGADIDYVLLKVENEMVADDGYYIVARDLVDSLFETKFSENLEKIEKGDWSSYTKPDGSISKIVCVEVGKGSELADLQYEPLYPFQESIASPEQKPLFEKAFHVFAADFVTTDSGTGIVHIAPMYGQDDFELGTREGLPKVHTVNEEAKFMPGTGFLEGRYVKEVDENGKPTLAVDIVNDLKARDLFFSQENYKHSYPHCWRCDTSLLYYARTSWYIAMSKIRDQLVAANETINWEPEHVREGRFGEWLSGLKDWAISRDRYWGTPLPIWETEDGTEKVVIGSKDDLRTYAKKSGNIYYAMRHGQTEGNIKGICDPLFDSTYALTELGRTQVKESAAQLKDISVDLIIASPLLRAKETADLVAETIGYQGEIVVDNRLAETNPGQKYVGTPWANIWVGYKTYPERYLQKNPDGENYMDVKRRVMEFLEECEAKYSGKTILIVSHGGPIENMILGSQGIRAEDIPEDVEALYYPKNGELRTIDFVPFPHNENFEFDLHKPYIDQVELELNGLPAQAGKPLKRVPEVMDVWFDSGSMPFAQDHKLGMPTELSPKHADYISEGLDQTRGWFYTLHAIANILSDEPAVAYKNVICLGLILDAQGQKMSKSRGNVANPWEMFDKYGADTIRLWMYSVNQPGDSKNFDEKTIAELQNKFFRVIENCVQIISFYDLTDDTLLGQQINSEEEPVLDRWLRAYVAKTHKTVTNALEQYDAFTAARALRDFVTELSQWYVRRSRASLKESPKSRGFYKVMLGKFAIMSAPFTPFTSEWLWKELKLQNQPNGESVHLMEWQQANENADEELLASMDQVRALVSKGLEARNRANLKVRQPLRTATLPTGALEKELEDIIKDELNVWNVVYDESATEVVLDTNIDDELRAAGNVREVIRAIQDMRKTAGLQPGDRITLLIDGDEIGKRLVLGNKEEISQVVSADSIQESLFDDGTFVQLDGSEITIKILQ